MKMDPFWGGGGGGGGGSPVHLGPGVRRTSCLRDHSISGKIRDLLPYFKPDPKSVPYFRPKSLVTRVL